MPGKSWKGAERRVAGDFGTLRTPLSGIAGGHNTHSDTRHPVLYIEVKQKQRAAIFPLLRDTRKKARAEGKRGLVVMCEKGTPLRALIMAQEDFMPLWELAEAVAGVDASTLQHGEALAVLRVLIGRAAPLTGGRQVTDDIDAGDPVLS